MCKENKTETEELPPSSLRVSSNVSSSDSSSDEDEWNNQIRGEPSVKRICSVESDEFFAKRGNPMYTVASIVSGFLMAVGFTAFALWFPFALAPHAANETYDWAYYNYDAAVSHFDNTIWTYGSDYLLGVNMALLSISILKYSRPGVTDKLCIRSASLLLGYCASVFAGGFCHHTYTTVEAKNSLSFRILWTICVGTVTAATCFMGLSASQALRQFQAHPSCSPLLKKVPVLYDSFWWSMGLTVTGVCAAGGMSFQRPACDIFIAGITQTPSTFYLMLFFFLVKHSKISLQTRIIGMVGFILNAPLLPMYPLLVQYTDLSLASVNTILHSWLCVAWTMQGYSLRETIKALLSDKEEAEAKIRLQKSQ